MTIHDIEIRAIQRAYDELKCLDPDGRSRAIEWLKARFDDEEIRGREAREDAARKKIAARGAGPTDAPR